MTSPSLAPCPTLPPPANGSFYRPSEVAAIVGTDRNTVGRALRAGSLQSYHVGATGYCYRISPDQLLAWLETPRAEAK